VRRRFRRGFDWLFNLIRRGRTTAVLSLAAVALAVALGGAVVLQLFHLSRDGEDLTFGQALWEAMIRTLDPGQLDVLSGSSDAASRWGFAIAALVLTLLGVLLVASLISIINNSVGAWVERSSRGRSQAPRSSSHRDFIVMLG
jgi:hypothetical protein